VHTTDSTRYTTTVTGKVADLKVGASVMVLGSGSTGTVAAQRIIETDGTTAAGPGAGVPGAGRQGQPPTDQGQGQPPTDQGRGAGTRGVVASVNGSTLTVTAADGSTVTVTTSADTTVTTRKTSSFADLAVGDSVRVAGERGDDGTLTAQSVDEGDAGGFGFGGRPGAGQGQGQGQGQGGQGQRRQRTSTTQGTTS
jgi:hypothetical protein